MTKSELLKEIDQLKSNIGGWDIEPDFLTKAAYVLGCYFDQKENRWKVYATDERGIEGVFFRTDNEGMAYDKLYELIVFHKKLYSKHPD